MKFRILGSSSSGNCALVTTPGCKVLIDAGFSARRLKQMLAGIGEDIQDIDAVFLTHEHGDHSVGIKGMAKLPRLRVFANRDTAAAVQDRLDRPVNWQLFETGSTFRFNDLEVASFSLPHDASDPVGFTFEAGGESLFNPRCKLAWVTDLGYASNLVRQRTADADCLVVEANHDSDLLEACEKRPWSTKQRIRGRHGHLSNKAAFELLAEMDRPRWRQICLAHVSRDCNRLDLIERLFRPLAHERHWGLDIIDPANGMSPAYDLASAG